MWSNKYCQIVYTVQGCACVCVFVWCVYVCVVCVYNVCVCGVCVYVCVCVCTSWVLYLFACLSVRLLQWHIQWDVKGNGVIIIGLVEMEREKEKREKDINSAEKWDNCNLQHIATLTLYCAAPGTGFSPLHSYTWCPPMALQNLGSSTHSHWSLLRPLLLHLLLSWYFEE